MILDAKGKACPLPVIMAKREIDNGENHITVLVDNNTAVENLKRLADREGFLAGAIKKDGYYQVHLTRNGEEFLKETAPANELKDYALFIGKDHIGEGEGELGYNLLKMALYTISQGKNIPKSIFFMNSGVKIFSDNEEQVIDSLESMVEKGCEILVCGTCLNFYGISDQLKVGSVSNMYEILEKMHSAAKVITF